MKKYLYISLLIILASCGKIEELKNTSEIPSSETISEYKTEELGVSPSGITETSVSEQEEFSN